VHLIIQVSRLRDGSRRITHITEVLGMEAEVVTLQDLFAFDYRAGIDAHGRFLGTLQPTGLRPRFLEGLAARGITLPLETFMAGPR
jgi:pilus assembly protein CpaF